MFGVCLTDIKDLSVIVRNKLWLIKDELKQLEEEKEKLETSGPGQSSDYPGPVTSCSVSGKLLPKADVTELNISKEKDKCKPKGTMVCPRKRDRSKLNNT